MEPYFYLIPAFIIFGLFVFYPFVKTIIMSMSTTNIRGEIKDFVGLENFKEILSSPDFYNCKFKICSYGCSTICTYWIFISLIS